MYRSRYRIPRKCISSSSPVTGTLASGKKLTVSAASANSWALKSGENSVNYTLNNGSDTKGDAATKWDFTKEQLTAGATQAIGIDVDDYSSKPAGTYTDTVTFTAKVESAAITVTINQSDWGSGYKSFTKDGVTVSADVIDSQDGNLMGGGTFSTTLGNFTKIVVTAAHCAASGTGWSGGSSSKTWAGTPASTVSFSGDFMGMGISQTTIVCTIVPKN
ncbi:MAG: hypothetical protein J6N15_01120 [Ruminiclostridium sp.]|nr:hypothetical protein [Ruminiclostridium sp.]